MCLVLISWSLTASLALTDTDVTYQAMNKALVTQVRYETLQVQQDEKIKDLKSEVSGLKLEGLVKDVFIVLLAVVQIIR